MTKATSIIRGVYRAELNSTQMRHLRDGTATAHWTLELDCGHRVNEVATLTRGSDHVAIVLPATKRRCVECENFTRDI